MSQISLSIVIPAYNAARFISHNLNVLTGMVESRSDCEIIVVDDGSTDETAAQVKSFESIRYFYQANAGPAAARNLGANEAKGSYLLFTDADCCPQHHWIDELMKGFLVSSDVGAVCGSYGIANSDSRLARCIQAEINFRHEKLMPDFPKSFGSYNFAIKKEIFDLIGGFSVCYRQASGEDNDLSYKLLKSGFRIYFNRLALVDHHHTESCLKYWREQFRHGFWRVQMYRQHPQMAGGDGYTFWKDIVEIPATVLIFIAFILLSLQVLSVISFSLLLCLFFLFEIFFSLYFIKKFIDILFFGVVMSVRAFVRTIGFSTGVSYLVYNILSQKN